MQFVLQVTGSPAFTGYKTKTIPAYQLFYEKFKSFDS